MCLLRSLSYGPSCWDAHSALSWGNPSEGLAATSYSALEHIVSDVTWGLLDNLSCPDFVTATAPHGSLLLIQSHQEAPSIVSDLVPGGSPLYCPCDAQPCDCSVECEDSNL